MSAKALTTRGGSSKDFAREVNVNIDAAAAKVAAPF